jgi:hypothetical protein
MTAVAYGPLIEAGRVGLRRLQLIDPQPGRVTAEVEDDYHRFFVELRHDGERITGVATNAKRFPWTTCPSAGDHLAERLAGAPLREVASRENPLAHCTHMLDLAILAAAHAQESEPTLYEMLVDDPHEGPRQAILRRNGVETLRWLIDGTTLVAPGMMARRDLRQLRDWIDEIEPALREPARVLRRGAYIARGRGFDFSRLTTASAVTANAAVACYTFSVEHGDDAWHLNNSMRDFDGLENRPLADRLSP